MKLKTWYGLNALVEIDEGMFHRAGLGKLVLPHPPVVNWLLRLWLNPVSRQRLSVLHEFGHFQTLPIIVFYIATLLVFAVLLDKKTWGALSLILIGTFALWELLSEIYTRLCAGDLYRVSYQEVPRWPRALFWTTVSVLLPGAWMVLIA